MSLITSEAAAFRRCYQDAEPKQFGNLHERMKYLIAVVSKSKGRPELQELLHAIYDLETEVSFYEPVSPPFGRRLVSFNGRLVNMDHKPVTNGEPAFADLIEQDSTEATR